MKKLLLTAAFCGGFLFLQAQSTSIEQVLKNIEQNNKTLKAAEQNTAADKLELKTENNLEDPQLSYTRKFGEQDGVSPEIEFEVTQSIDFPTLYALRRSFEKLQGQALDLQHAVTRRDILLKAKELCLDLIWLNQQQALLDQQIKNAEELVTLYEDRFDKGGANILELNKVKMELMSFRTAIADNNAAHRKALQDLLAMNGNLPIEFTETVYPAVPELGSYETLRDEIYGKDYQLRSAQTLTEAARKQVTVNKHNWLPKLEVGYAREGGSNEMTNGFIVGLSIPIFNNRNKVKIARARQLSTELNQEQISLQLEADLQSLYNEACQLKQSIQVYDKQLMEQTMAALDKAVKVGQISVIDYYREAETVYQNQSQLLELENRYQKVLAQIYKNDL